MTETKPSPASESSIAQRRKAQVLEAAAECFRRRGFHRSSMAQISAAAGMSSGHIYHYFKNKEDIIAAIVERERSEIELIIDRMRQAPTPADSIALFLDHIPEGVALHKNASRASLTMEILAEASRNPEIARVVQQNDQTIHQSMTELFQDDSPKTRSRLEIMSALMEGLSVRALRNPECDKDIDLDMLRDTFFHLLKY